MIADDFDERPRPRVHNGHPFDQPGCRSFVVETAAHRNLETRGVEILQFGLQFGDRVIHETVYADLEDEGSHVVTFEQ